MTLSVRARLTLTSCALIALSLLVFAAAVRVSVERILVGGVERALIAQARGIAGEMARNPPGPPPNGPRRADDPFVPGDALPPDRDHGPDHPPRDLPPGALLPARDILPGGFVAHPYGAALWSDNGFDRARHGHPGFDREVRDGQPILVYSIPTVGGRVVQTAASLAAADVALRAVSVALALLLPVLVALSALVGAAIAARALRPVGQLADAAATIEASRLDQRLPTGSADEFGRLTGVLNSMLARLEAAFQRQRRFTADASHELRTPLTVIKSSVELIREHDEVLTPDERAETLAAIETAADRATRTVTDLLTLARGERGALPVHRSSVALEPLLAEIARTARRSRGGAAAVEIAVDPAVRAVSSDPDLLSRLIGNLLENALRHTPETGRVTVAAQRVGDALELRVADTGEGIAPEHLARLGEPFYRVDAARTRDRGGSGLGLSLCQAIASALDGALTIASEPGRGTTVTVRLP